MMVEFWGWNWSVTYGGRVYNPSPCPGSALGPLEGICRGLHYCSVGAFKLHILYMLYICMGTKWGPQI